MRKEACGNESSKRSNELQEKRGNPGLGSCLTYTDGCARSTGVLGDNWLMNSHSYLSIYLLFNAKLDAGAKSFTR